MKLSISFGQLVEATECLTERFQIVDGVLENFMEYFVTDIFLIKLILRQLFF
jgi:hypothetical protein